MKRALRTSLFFLPLTSVLLVIITTCLAPFPASGITVPRSVSEVRDLLGIQLLPHESLEDEDVLKALSEIDFNGKPADIPVGNLTQESHDKLVKLRKATIKWASKSVVNETDNVISQPGCGTPNRFSCDCTFWNGIACSHAQDDTEFTCDNVAKSQSPDGMIWRSPWEARAMNSTNPDFFSRDQGLGVLCSLLHDYDTSWYDAWYGYIDSLRGSMCPGLFYDCWFVTPFWCTFDKVTTAAGLKQPDPKWMLPPLGEGACNNDHLYLYISCSFNENGSGLHLAGLDVYIRRMLGDWDAVVQASADALHRRDPQNGFFNWLSNGASDDLVTQLVNQMPTDGERSDGWQWSFVREDSEMAWLASMGYEFIFLIDHLLEAPIVSSTRD